MNRKKILDKRKLEIGFLAGLLLCFFTWVANGVTKIMSDYDIMEFRSKSMGEVGKKIEIKIEIQNNGSTNPGAVLTVFGKQGNTMIPLTPETGLLIFDKPDKERTKITLTYAPLVTGDVVWHATLDDGNPDIDEALFSTVVFVKDEDGTTPPAVSSENFIALHDSSSSTYNHNCTSVGDVRFMIPGLK